MKAVAQICCEI